MPGSSIDRFSPTRLAPASLALVACALVSSGPAVNVAPPTADLAARSPDAPPDGHPTHAPLAAAGAVNDATVHPLVLLSLDDERLAFSALGRDWEVALEPRELLSATARAELADVSLPRLFGGRVVGDASSWVRLSDDQGRLSGHLFADGGLYRIEPPAGTPTRPSGTPGVTGAWDESGYRLVRVGTGAAPGAALVGRTSTPPTVSRAMRVGIVVDSRYDAYHDGRGLARALSVMNGVDGLYREQLGLAVVVERVRVHDDPATDPVRTRGGTIEEVLTAFRGIRLGDPGLPADLALVHLFSGHETADDVIGLGWIDTACRVDGFDVSMSTPFTFDTLLSAHEIAHNLGALHDEDPLCASADDGAAPGGLMEERLSQDTVTAFSACSLERLQRVLGADCLLDSLDLALDVTVTAAATPDERLVAVRVTNTDPFRTARAVRTRTRLPAGARIDEVAAGCRASEALLVCDHGDVAPEAAATVTARVALSTPPGRDGDTGAVTVIDPGAFVDSDPANDRVELDLVASSAAPANTGTTRVPDDGATGGPLADATPSPATPDTDTDGGGGGAGDDTAGGPAGPLLLSLLALLAGGRRRRASLGYRSRSTE